MQTKGSDCRGGEDFYGDMWRVLNDADSKNCKFGVISNDNAPSCNWGCDALTIGGKDSIYWEFWLNEADKWFCGADDKYDTTPWSGRQSISWFSHSTTVWQFRDDNGLMKRNLCLLPFPQYSCGGADSLKIITDTTGTGGQAATVGHRLVVKQVEP